MLEGDAIPGGDDGVCRYCKLSAAARACSRPSKNAVSNSAISCRSLSRCTRNSSQTAANDSISSWNGWAPCLICKGQQAIGLQRDEEPRKRLLNYIQQELSNTALWTPHITHILQRAVCLNCNLVLMKFAPIKTIYHCCTLTASWLKTKYKDNLQSHLVYCSVILYNQRLEVWSFAPVFCPARLDGSACIACSALFAA